MRWQLAVICVATLTLGVAGAGDEQKKEFDRLAGAWTVDGLRYDGAEHKLKFKIVFKGNEGKVEGNAAVTDQYGGIKFTLDPKAAPQTVNNFVFLAENHFYDGLSFQRVIPGFIAQAGAPNPDGTGGPGYTIPDESSPLMHDTGAVAMAA